MGGRGSEVQILSPRPLPPDIGGSREAASVFVCDPGRAPPSRSGPPSGLAPHTGSPNRLPRTQPETDAPMIPLLHPLAVLLARLLPARAAYALGRLAARGFWAADASRRRAVLANLARVAPGLDAAGRVALAHRM